MGVFIRQLPCCSPGTIVANDTVAYSIDLGYPVNLQTQDHSYCRSSRHHMLGRCSNVHQWRARAWSFSYISFVCRNDLTTFHFALDNNLVTVNFRIERACIDHLKIPDYWEGAFHLSACHANELLFVWHITIYDNAFADCLRGYSSPSF